MSVYEAKTQLSKCIDEVLEGNSVIITRHGNPVVELVPVANGGVKLGFLAHLGIELGDFDIDSVDISDRLTPLDLD